MFKVLDVVFESQRELFKLLGYKCTMSKSQIIKQNGSYENLIKRRLCVDTDNEAKMKLLELKEKSDQAKNEKTASAILNAGNENSKMKTELALSVLKTLFIFSNEDAQTKAIKAVSMSKGLDFSEVFEAVKTYING